MGSKVNGAIPAGVSIPTFSPDREAWWLRFVARQRASGLSGRAFCLREGVDPFTFYFWRRRLVKRGALAPEDAPAARDSGGAGAAPASRDVSCVGVAGQAESQRSAAAQALFAEVALPAFDEPAAARAESIPGACAPGGDARACDGAAGTGIAGREVPEPDALDLAGAAATQPFEIVYPQGLVVRVPPVFDAEALSRVLACVLSYAMAYGDVSGACLPGVSGSVPALSAGSAREAR